MDLTYKNSFWGYFSFYYRIVGSRFFVYLGLSIIISLMDGLGLAMFIPLLQSVSNEDSAGKDGALGQLHDFIRLMEGMGLTMNLTTVLMILISLFVLKGIFKYIQLNYYASIRQFFIKKVRYKMVSDLEHLAYGAFIKHDAGKIQNTLTGEVARLFNTMTLYFTAAQLFVMLVTYIGLAFMANYQFALLVVLGAALSNSIYRKIFAITKKASADLSEKGSDFNGFLVQSIHYFKYLKSTNTFSQYSSKLLRVIDETENLNKKMGNLKAIALSIKEPIIITIVVTVIMIQVSWMGTNLTTILASLLFFYRALTFLVSLQNDWHGFVENSGGMEAVSKLSAEFTEFREPTGNRIFHRLEKEVLFRNVEFRYDNKVALDNITVSVPAKQTIAFIGESGSGKTTLANMVAALYKPQLGDILIDDIPLKEYDLASYRNKIGYISQESVIFNDDIFNNITFWAPRTPENMKKFIEVTRMASLFDFIDTLPEKELTKLGDNGMLISGGQKQRISIARELYKNSEILIFDEATSALDSETEMIIQQNIEQLHGSYTMIVIAHRLSTIKNADLIYLLEDGKILASGTFDEMISKSTRFKKMVMLQAV
ncbi:ABC transporter ATP-binding protein [Flavitalea antarctica]